jgi:hypothetical protein
MIIYHTGNYPLIWGCDPAYMGKPITNLPCDTVSVKIKFRPKREAVAFVKTECYIRQYVLAPDGENVKLGMIKGENAKAKKDRPHF